MMSIGKPLHDRIEFDRNLRDGCFGHISRNPPQWEDFAYRAIRQRWNYSPHLIEPIINGARPGPMQMQTSDLDIYMECPDLT